MRRPGMTDGAVTTVAGVSSDDADDIDRDGRAACPEPAGGARSFVSPDFAGYIQVDRGGDLTACRTGTARFASINKTYHGMHAPPDDAVPNHRRAAGTAQFVGFRLANQNYVFHIERIREIVIPTGIASLPEVPACVDGVSNLRGSIIPIVNLRVLFGLERRPVDAETRTIVVHVGQRLMGCVVDSVSRVMRIAADRIQPAHDAVLVSGRGFIEGFARVGDDLYIVIDVDQLLDPTRLDEVQRAATARPTDPSSAPGAA
jgi:purine-binding chemotaxis protein CheW